MQAQERRSTPAVLFDSSIEDDISQVLALTMLLGYDSKREVRLTSLSISRNNLRIATFCDLMTRFFGVAPSIGMSESGAARTSVPPALEAALMKKTAEDKSTYNRTVARLNDTADPIALMRNALTAQQDQNSVMILAGPPVNLLGMLALPGTKSLIQKKVRSLIIAAPFIDAPGMGKLLAEWPGPIVFVEESLGQSHLFPAESIEKDFAWAANHPLVDAYRAANTMPYDTPTSAMAAVLQAAHPEENHFTLSEPGSMQFNAGGRAQFTPNPQGKHRRLLADAEKKEKVIQAYRTAVTIRPPEPRRGGRGPQE